jgi:hypothetical protein
MQASSLLPGRRSLRTNCERPSRGSAGFRSWATSGSGARSSTARPRMPFLGHDPAEAFTGWSRRHQATLAHLTGRVSDAMFARSRDATSRRRRRELLRTRSCRLEPATPSRPRTRWSVDPVRRVTRHADAPRTPPPRRRDRLSNVPTTNERRAVARFRSESPLPDSNRRPLPYHRKSPVHSRPVGALHRGLDGTRAARRDPNGQGGCPQDAPRKHCAYAGPVASRGGCASRHRADVSPRWCR